MEFRSAYDDVGYVAKGLDTSGDEIRTEQSHKGEVDVNQIMEKYVRTGTLEHRNEYVGQYGDVTGIDFQTAMNIVVDAQNMFNDLPSSVRNKFQNDPARFLDFVQDAQNREELIEMGLATPDQTDGDPTDVPPPAPAPAKEVAAEPAK